jgi:hypothetical protein
LVVAVGCGLGAVGRLSDGWPHAPRALFALGAPWIVAAAVVGVVTDGRRRAALAGASALVISVAVYYAVMTLLERRVSAGYAIAMTVGCGSMAAVVGGVFGAAGACLGLDSARARSVAAALLGGALAGEALLFLLRGASGEAALLLASQAAVGIAGALALAEPRWRVRAFGVTATLAAIACFADAAARLIMHRYGWGGA